MACYACCNADLQLCWWLNVCGASQRLLPVKQSVLLVRGLCVIVVGLFVDDEHHLHCYSCAVCAVSETCNGFGCFAICGDLGVYLVVRDNAACDALDLHVSSLRAAVGRLLQAGLSRRELLATHCAGGALALIGLGLGLGADGPHAAPANIVAAWRDNVLGVGAWSGWVNVIGAADIVSQLSLRLCYETIGPHQFSGTRPVAQLQQRVFRQSWWYWASGPAVAVSGGSSLLVSMCHPWWGGEPFTGTGPGAQVILASLFPLSLSQFAGTEQEPQNLSSSLFLLSGLVGRSRIAGTGYQTQ